MSRLLGQMVRDTLALREIRSPSDLLNADQPCQCRICIDDTASLVEPKGRP